MAWNDSASLGSRPGPGSAPDGRPAPQNGRLRAQQGDLPAQEGPAPGQDGRLPAQEGRPALVDRFGRVARKLRVSVTDRCNFRCVYCMPDGEIPWLDRSEVLTFEEIARVVRIATTLGVEKVRLTGGEPLARRDLERLVAMLKEQAPSLRAVTMTTNGYFLPEKARLLKEAGLDGINISLDTLQRDRFIRLTRRDCLPQVLEGIAAAEEAGLQPIKINAVVMRGYNDDEIPAFVELARRKAYSVRFIEFMPLDGDRIWNRSLVVPAAEILERARQGAQLVEAGNDPSDPAREYRFADDPEAPGTIGIIASVSQPFCRHCDRIRLTADGKVRNCLFALEEHDLRQLLRSGAPDEQIAQALRRAVWVKWRGHLINQANFVQPERAMYAIGG